LPIAAPSQPPKPGDYWPKSAVNCGWPSHNTAPSPPPGPNPVPERRQRTLHLHKALPNSTANSLLLGVDGGGTKTVAWLAPLDDDANSIVLGRGQAGPGNPRAAGFEAAQANILAAIEAAFAAAGLPRCPAIAACFGLAGAGREIEQQQIAAWATSLRIAHSVHVTGDAEPILAAASPDNCGIALICGTGSLAWGRNASGKIARCGGWGYLLGDEGSAYTIARAGLTAAMQVADGRGPGSTALLDLFQSKLNATTPEGLIEHVYAPAMTRDRLAELALVVFEASSTDPAAGGIIATAAAELAHLVAALTKKLSLKPHAYALACAGSVILNQPAFRAQILDRLRSQDVYPATVALVTDPVRGAVALARRAAIAARL
jgi:N-acetylglucosamine kinase-like BadF-type ATPase